MSDMLGADLDALARLASAMGSSADQLERIRGFLGSRVRAVEWGGADGARVRADWDRRIAPYLANAAQGLRDAERVLRTQGQQQVEASGGGSASAQVAALLAGLGLSAAAVRRLVAEAVPPFAQRLVALGGAAMSVLDVLEVIRTYSGTWKAMDEAARLYSIAAAFTGKALSAGDFLRNVSREVPILDSFLAVTDIAWNWRTHGLHTPETNEALVIGPLGVAAGVVGGPLGGIAFTTGTLIGKAITTYTPVDEIGAQAGFDTAFGDRIVNVPDKSAEWYRTASEADKEQLAAQHAAAGREAARIVERTEKPWLFVGDYITGGIKGWLR